MDFVSARRDSRREPRCSGSWQFAADDLPALPRTGNTGAGAHVVFDCTGSKRESDRYAGGQQVRAESMAKRETNAERRAREHKGWAIDQIANWIVWRINRRRVSSAEQVALDHQPKHIDAALTGDALIESESIEN